MITTFTRVHTDDLDSLISDEEVVLALINDFGFSTDDLKQMASQPEEANPEALFNTLQARWSGHGQVFSLEDQAPLLLHIVHHTKSLENSPISGLIKAARATSIHTSHGPVRVLFPSQIESISHALEQLPVENIQGFAQLESLNQAKVPPHKSWGQQELITAPLWQIYDGLCTFFANATANEEYILVAMPD